MRINFADRVSLNQQAVSRMYLGQSLVWTADPAIDLVFDGRALDTRMTFTRPSTATLFDNSGVLLSSAIDQPRYTHHPTSLNPCGLLIEEQRTNVIPNAEYSGLSNNSGANANTPFVVRTYFTQKGRRVYRLRYEIPVPANASYPQEYVGHTLSVAGVYASSSWKRFISLSATGANFVTFDNRGSPVRTEFSEWQSAIYETKASSSSQVVTAAYTLLVYANGLTSAQHLEYETSCMQKELGAYSTSYIPTTGVARTRATDSATLNPQGWLSAEKGVFVLEHDVPTGRPLLGNGSVVLLSSVGPGKTAFQYDASGAFIVHNGGAPQSATFPSFASSLQLLGAGAARANAAISRLMYYPRRVTVQELQGMTL